MQCTHTHKHARTRPCTLTWTRTRTLTRTRARAQRARARGRHNAHTHAHAHAHAHRACRCTRRCTCRGTRRCTCTCAATSRSTRVCAREQREARLTFQRPARGTDGARRRPGMEQGATPAQNRRAAGGDKERIASGESIHAAGWRVVGSSESSRVWWVCVPRRSQHGKDTVKCDLLLLSVWDCLSDVGVSDSFAGRHTLDTHLRVQSNNPACKM